LQVIFYTKPKQNMRASEEAGRPIFDEIEMVQIKTADKHFEPHFPAHEPTVTWDAQRQEDDRRTWAERYPAEYKAFKMGHAGSVSGTPLAEWPILSRAKVSELTAIGIVTVEQIAEMSDRHRSVLGAGARQLINQAQAYIAQARENAPNMAAAAMNAELMGEMERLKRELDELRAAQPKRGRPRKEAEDGEEAA
jgi:hypothetical protein